MKLNDSLGFLLNKSAGEMKHAFENALRPYNLTPGQWSVLSQLSNEDGQTISELGKSLFYDKPTISGIIRRLNDKELIKKTSDPCDQRVSRIFITDKAKTLMVELPALAMGVNKKALKGFSQEETVLLKSFLRTILRNMQ